MIKRTIRISSPSYLSLRNGQMVVKAAEIESCKAVDEQFKLQYERTVPIEDLAFVMIENKRVTMTAGLMSALSEVNCAVAVCGETMMPAGLMLPLSANSTLTERMRNQMDASLPLKKQMWQQTVRAKILNQSVILDYATGDNHQCMRKWAADVRSGDPDNLEGRAAAYYWKNLFSSLTPNFCRNPEGDWPNAILNYGYAVVRALVARALVGSGLSPTVGIFHRNKYNAYCLADDIMEPYRPVVDLLTFRLIKTKTECRELTKDMRREMLLLPQVDVRIDGHLSPMMNAVSVTAASVSACFCGEAKKILYPEMIC